MASCIRPGLKGMWIKREDVKGVIYTFQCGGVLNVYYADYSGGVPGAKGCRWEFHPGQESSPRLFCTISQVYVADDKTARMKAIEWAARNGLSCP